MKIRDNENYLNDVITANVTIASFSRFKENIRELDPKLLEIELPAPKIYERTKEEKKPRSGS